MINAIPHQLRKGETKLDACKDLDDVDPLVVTVNPDPLPANFTVFGKLSENYITAGKTFLRIECDEVYSNNSQATYIIRLLVNHAHKAGEQFTILADHVMTPNLPGPYSIVVAVVNNQPNDLKNSYEVHACCNCYHFTLNEA
ncbi:hypothetical protein C1646_665413 [Rhizophagus diaphanus]|nr:hypothetical protein C1646_665413 [Rhizophagus diaphanus] [Rhizophagus sp. MUCL 43196]